jgi:hypothetical protein
MTSIIGLNNNDENEELGNKFSKLQSPPSLFPIIMAAYLLLVSFVAASGVLAAFLMYQIVIAPRSNPLRQIAGPPVPRWFGNHLFAVLEYAIPQSFASIFI